jgi:peptidyl-tRNA hydrolase, PTH1 family
MAIEYLVVGLGNPGEQYRHTPHNLGFLVVDRLAETNAIRVTRKENMSLVGLGRVAGKEVAVAQPQTFMNVNGPAVKGLLERYEVVPNQLIVVYDELALPWGQLRIRKNGSAGGHNGIKSLIASLATDEFVRLRVGINPGTPVEMAKFVLAPFRRAQMQDVAEAVAVASAAVEAIIAEGADKAMATYNRRAQGLQQEEA